MSDDFVTLVIAMREAQREFFETHNKSLIAECKRLETKVDTWIQKYLAERVQLDLWTRAIKGSETPGVYTVAHDEEITEVERAE
jgi:hypothetical protein